MIPVGQICDRTSPPADGPSRQAAQTIRRYHHARAPATGTAAAVRTPRRGPRLRCIRLSGSIRRRRPSWPRTARRDGRSAPRRRRLPRGIGSPPGRSVSVYRLMFLVGGKGIGMGLTVAVTGPTGEIGISASDRPGRLVAQLAGRSLCAEPPAQCPQRALAKSISRRI